MRTYIIMCRHLGFFVLGVLLFLLIIFFWWQPFLPIFLIDGEVVHFPIICEFRHWVTRVREMDGIANLSIGDMERSDAKVSAEIASGGKGQPSLLRLPPCLWLYRQCGKVRHFCRDRLSQSKCTLPRQHQSSHNTHGYCRWRLPYHCLQVPRWNWNLDHRKYIWRSLHLSCHFVARRNQRSILIFRLSPLSFAVII